MTQTKEFMLLFRFEPNFNHQPTEVELKQMHQSWGGFIGNIAIQEKLVSTHQLGFEGNLIFNGKPVESGIHIAENKTLAGNMIVKAANLEEATEMAKSCPILEMGGMVEVRSISPM